MTANQVFDEVGLTLPNTIEQKLLLIWLNRLEQYAAVEIEGLDCHSISAISSNDTDNPLRIPDPYSSVYPLYLQCMIHLAMGEYDRYTAMYKFFNTAYSDYAKWYQRNKS